jgi:hypothetical protein
MLRAHQRRCLGCCDRHAQFASRLEHEWTGTSVEDLGVSVACLSGASVAWDELLPARLPNQPVMSMITSDVTLLVRQMVPSAAVGTIAEFARARPTRGFNDETEGSGTSQGNARIHPVDRVAPR